MKQDKIFFVFQSPLNPTEQVLNKHIALHGDGVKDVAFTVDNAQLVFQVLNLNELLDVLNRKLLKKVLKLYVNHGVKRILMEKLLWLVLLPYH